MEIFYNELSNQPLSANSEEAKSRIMTLLATMNSLREYDINIMRTHDGFYAEQLAENYSMANFFGDPTVSWDLKLLLRTVVANPYIEDTASYEAELFISNTFNSTNHSGDNVSPEGLAGAYVFNLPVISISSHEYWRRSHLTLTISSNDTPSVIKNEDILNVYSSNCINGKAFLDWLSYLNPPVPLNSEENIYSVFSASQYQFEARAIDDIILWFFDDKRYLIRVKELLEDIPLHPFFGGKGKTELLRGTDGKASKRIVKKDRVIYTYTKDKIIIHQCRGHYDDK